MKAFLLALTLISTSLMAETIKIDVNGMVCSMCIQGIKKKFSDVEQVTKVDVDLDAKVVTLETHGKNDLGDVKIKSLIKDSGYDVVNIARK